jgi:cytochrome bd-type quinol oxidase subunit 2
MFFDIDDTTRRKARAPHELAMINLIVFNLLIGVALLAGSMAEPDSTIARFKWVAVAIPLVVSLVLMGVTWTRSRQQTGGSDAGNTWFAQTHWRLAARRYRLILIGYLVCAALLSIALIGKHGSVEVAEQLRSLPPAMQEMERRKLESQDMASAVWARIGVVPLLLVVMVTIMLESGALYQAGRGELPDALVARFPPPDGVRGSASEPSSA